MDLNRRFAVGVHRILRLAERASGSGTVLTNERLGDSVMGMGDGAGRFLCHFFGKKTWHPAGTSISFLRFQTFRTGPSNPSPNFAATIPCPKA